MPSAIKLVKTQKPFTQFTLVRFCIYFILFTWSCLFFFKGERKGFNFTFLVHMQISPHLLEILSLSHMLFCDVCWKSGHCKFVDLSQNLLYNISLDNGRQSCHCHMFCFVVELDLTYNNPMNTFLFAQKHIGNLCASKLFLLETTTMWFVISWAVIF